MKKKNNSQNNQATLTAPPISMNPKTNNQHQSDAASTPYTDELVSLKHAADVLCLKEVTLRSWCNRGKIPWEQNTVGKKNRCLVRLSDVSNYLETKPGITRARAKAKSAALQSGETTVSPEPSVIPPKNCSVSQTVLHSNKAQEMPELLSSVIPNVTDNDGVLQQSITLELKQSAQTETIKTPPAVSDHSGISKTTSQSELKAKSKPRVPAALFLHRVKNSMRKFSTVELLKISNWINGRLTCGCTSNNKNPETEQSTLAS